MKTTLRLWLAAAIAFFGLSSVAFAQPTNCQAIAKHLGAPSLLVPVSMQPASDAAYSVSIEYVGHSTFRITAPDGTVIATDYAGSAGEGPLPDVVTMNHAHSSHWTPFPDPGIPHVLRGWNPEGGRASHNLIVGEVLIRNVPTDIRYYGGVEESGNSIFIFEIQGLCLGHLGHLHQPLSDGQIAEIGRLDIVFVPIDGTYTMGQPEMMKVVNRLRASLVIPMHWFSQMNLARFVTESRDYGLDVALPSEPVLTVSLNTLPSQPTLTVLPRQQPF